MEVGLLGHCRDPMFIKNRRVSQHAQSLRYEEEPCGPQVALGSPTHLV